MTQTTQPKLYARTLTFTAVNVKKDKKGMPFANFKADTIVRSGAKAGERINIFGQIFGKQYEDMKDEIRVGNTISVLGVQDQRRADAENNVTAVRSFVIRARNLRKSETASQQA